METPRPRFHNTETTEDPNAPLRHIEIDPFTGRDRFGNRVVSSNRLAYRDQEGRSSKAALLITPDGEAFLKSNPGLLTKLDHALREVGPRIQDKKYRVGRAPFELQPGYTLHYMDGGGQSEVFRLTTPTGTYVIKVHVCFSKLHQPYTNELLQMQALATERKAELAELGIAFPRTLFASGQVLCQEFVPKEIQVSDEFAATNYAMAVIADDYIAEQKRNQNDLWTDIHVDKVHKKTILPLSNYRQRTDGSLLWIDPFASFHKNEPVPPQIRLSPEEVADLPHLSIEEMRTHYIAAQQDMRTLIHTVEGYPDYSDVDFIANAHQAFRALGVEPHTDPDSFSIDYAAAKRQILKRHGIRWMLIGSDM